MTDESWQGNKVFLRRAEQGDADLVAKWKSDPLVRRMALDADTVVSAIKEEKDILRSLESGDQIYRIVVVRETGQPIGYVRANWMDRSKRLAWLRYALGEERGKGYARDALKHFLQGLFPENAHRVEAEAYEFNEAGIGLLESLGFRREGLKREAHFDGERYRHVIVLGLLVGEWESLISVD